MSFSTFTTNVQNLAWRPNDTELSSALAWLSTLAESRLNRDLRLRKMMTSASLTVSPPNDPDLPSDFLEAISAKYVESASGVSDQIRFITPQQMDDIKERYETPSCMYAAVVGADLVIHKMPETVASGTQTVTLQYYGKVPVFSTADSSWLYDDHPDLYTAAVMMQVGDFIREDELTAKSTAQYAAALQEVRLQESREKVGPRPVIRMKGFAA